jgi:ribose 5-phosphate isomerase A
MVPTRLTPNNRLIKGRGGAMFKEKLLISSSKVNYIIVDDTKLVDKLGTNFPVPVEVFPQALLHVEAELKKLGANSIELRPAKGKDGPIITENGNLILDCRFDESKRQFGTRYKSHNRRYRKRAFYRLQSANFISIK